MHAKRETLSEAFLARFPQWAAQANLGIRLPLVLPEEVRAHSALGDVPCSGDTLAQLDEVSALVNAVLDTHSDDMSFERRRDAELKLGELRTRALGAMALQVAAPEFVQRFIAEHQLESHVVDTVNQLNQDMEEIACNIARLQHQLQHRRESHAELFRLLGH